MARFFCPKKKFYARLVQCSVFSVVVWPVALTLAVGFTKLDSSHTFLTTLRCVDQPLPAQPGSDSCLRVFPQATPELETAKNSANNNNNNNTAITFCGCLHFVVPVAECPQHWGVWFFNDAGGDIFFCTGSPTGAWISGICLCCLAVVVSAVCISLAGVRVERRDEMRGCQCLFV